MSAYLSIYFLKDFLKDINSKGRCKEHIGPIFGED